MALFKNIASQYIDDNGKTRSLTFKSGVCLMTPPLPPFNVPIDKTIRSVSQKIAKKFIQEQGLKITMQDGDADSGSIQGFRVRPIQPNDSGINSYYIPIIPSKAIEGIAFAPPTFNDPLRTDETSELENMYRFRKIADFLKQYVMYQYSLNPEEFSKDIFEIVPDHDYEISLLNKKLYVEDNNVMYTKNGKLIVPSEDVRDRLIDFLKVQLLNDTPGVMEYRERAVVKDYYRTLVDFLKVRGQLIFLTKQSLERWKTESVQTLSSKGGYRNEVLTYTRPDITEPYFYRNHNIMDGRLILIQNVKDGDINIALSIGEKWMETRVNPGYSAEISDTSNHVTYTIYTEDGKGSTIEGIHGYEHVHIFEYYDGSYAAILFI